MICENRQESLLMLVHGDLHGLSKLKMLLHLLICRGCRAQYGELYQVSQTFATALENPELGVKFVARPTMAASIKALVGILAIVLVAVGSIVMWAHGNQADHCVPSLVPTLSTQVHPAKMRAKQKKLEETAKTNLPGKTCD